MEILTNEAFDDLEIGRVYRVKSRNLNFAVFNGHGFIGIREKMGSRYLFTEYSTVRAVEPTDKTIEPPMRLWESYPTICLWCGERAEWNKDTRWTHLREVEDCNEARGTSRTYGPLFQLLDELEEEEELNDREI